MLTWKGSGLGSAPTREGTKMKYKVLKTTIANGVRVNAGDIIELGAAEAHSLKGYGRIEPVTEQEIRVAEAPEIEHRDPVLAAPKRGRPRGR